MTGYLLHPKDAVLVAISSNSSLDKLSRSPKQNSRTDGFVGALLGGVCWLAIGNLLRGGVERVVDGTTARTQPIINLERLGSGARFLRVLGGLDLFPVWERVFARASLETAPNMFFSRRSCLWM